MNYVARRTVTEFDEAGSPHVQKQEDKTLEEFRNCSTYVLLGSAGAGKTTEFEQEAKSSKRCQYVSAREFLSQEEGTKWKGKTLFIDGLDEVRAGHSDVRIPFDQIRMKLNKLGKPRIRLSCREADWYGASDLKSLRDVTPDGKVAILRLNPLSDHDVTEILRREYGVNDPRRFLGRAEALGVNELLDNPQSLRMLVKAVGQGESWPETRRQTFEMACMALVKEFNEEHLIGNPHRSTAECFSLAGRLCAILILTGSSGYTRDPDALKDLIQISDVSTKETLESIRQVLASRLFETSESDSHLPQHRQVAEFLGSMYLTTQINKGLPPSRILSLMTYNDGSIVTEMRGMGAWLAANCISARDEFISRDPVGTLLYGDVESFSAMEKCRILINIRALLGKDPQALRVLVNDARIGDLATEDTAPLFEETLSISSPSEHIQRYARTLISALNHGTVHPELNTSLWNVVNNSHWHSAVRVATLDLLLSKNSENATLLAKFQALLKEIHAGVVEDEDDELRGTLLHHCCSHGLGLTELLNYLDLPKRPNLFGTYQNFWLHLNHDEVPFNVLGKALDTIQLKFDDYRSPATRLALTAPLIGKVFLRILRKFVDVTPVDHIDKLIQWLEVAQSLRNPGSRETDHLQQSLNNRVDLLDVIVPRYVETSIQSSDFKSRMLGIDGLLFNVKYQILLGTDWFVQKSFRSTDRYAADWYISRLAVLVYNQSGASKRECSYYAERYLREKPVLFKEFTEKIRELESGESRRARLAREHSERTRERQRNWREAIKANRVGDGHCPSELLNRLAQVYFGEVIEIEGNSPKERLQDLLGEDSQGEIDKILEELQLAIYRDDLPDPEIIFKLRSKQLAHVLALPILAGLQEASTLSDSKELSLDERQRHAALAIYHSVWLPQNATRPPRWLTNLIDSQPDSFAEILAKSVSVRLKAGDPCREICYELAFSPKHSSISQRAVLPLLGAFPVRCANQLLIALTWLLRAASIHCATDNIRGIVESRLAKSGMNMGQKVVWLGAQLLLDQEQQRESFQTYVSFSDQRVEHLVQFLSEQDSTTKWFDAIDSSTSTMLVSVIGRRYGPVLFDNPVDVYSSESSKASGCVSTLIDKLAFDPSEDAKRFLNELMLDNDLSKWHSRLRHAEHTQSTVRNQSQFQIRDLRSVTATLNNREPANVTDLKVIALETLDQIHKTLRDGDTSGWRKFWNSGSPHRVLEPKSEPDCCNIMVDELRAILNYLNISIQAESQYADRKRCDITFSVSNFRLPMEIKLSHSRDLFTAIDTQLVKNYARDNLCDGHGIYLVLWFGKTEHSQPTSLPNRTGRPSGSKHLEIALRETISSDQSDKIAVCVIDVSETQ